MAFHLYKRGKVSGVFAQNIVLFVPSLLSDIRTGLFNAIWNISIIPTTASNLEYTLDDGVTWFPLTSGVIPANKETICNILCDGDDVFNIRCPDVAGCTIYRLVVSIAPVDFQQRELALGSGGAIPVNICPVECAVPVSGTVSLTTLSTVLSTIFNLARIANQEWFASDISLSGLIAGQGATAEIHFAVTPRRKIEYTLDSGTTWVTLNNDLNVEADSGQVFTIPMIFGDLLNFRSAQALTVIFARVVQT